MQRISIYRNARERRIFKKGILIGISLSIIIYPLLYPC